MPAAQVFPDTIRLWRQIVNRKKGILTSRKVLKVIVKRLKFSLNNSKPLSVKQANAKLTKAYQSYFKASPTFPLLREEFQLGLIEAVANDKDRSAV